MPLQRKLGSSRSSIEGVEFVMMIRDGTPVPCTVTKDALKMLFGSGGMATVGQLAVFDQCRDKIEAVAETEDLVRVGFVSVPALPFLAMTLGALPRISSALSHPCAYAPTAF